MRENTVRDEGMAGFALARRSDERDPSYLIVALRVDLRSVLRDHDLRRHLNQRLEPAESAGETDAGVVTGRHTATNRDGLEHCWPDLLVHPEKHESPIRPDGASVHRRLDPAEGVQVRSECRRRLRFRRNCPGIPGARGPQQAGFVRIEHRPSGAATGQQQHQRRRQLREGRPAADECSYARAFR